MKKLKVFTVMSVIALNALCGASAFGQDPVKVLAIGGILNELRSTAESIINNVDYTVNKNVNVAALNVLNVISQFETTYSSMLDKTTNELSKQKQQLFNGLETQIKKVFDDIEKANENIDNSLENLSLYLSGTVFGDKVPRITKFNFGTMIRGIDDKIIIQFKGVCLNSPKNYLKINGKKMKPIEYSDNTLKFSVNTADFKDYYNQEPKVIFENIELFCAYKKCLLNKNKSYKFAVQTLPKKLGIFTFEYVVKNTERIIENKTVGHWRIESKSSSRNKSENRNFAVFPDNGFRINTDSIKIWMIERTGSCKGCRINVINQSQTGYTVDAHIEAKRYYRWCRVDVYSSFQQYRDSENNATIYSKEEDLDAQIDKSFDLQENTDYFKRLVVTLFNGKKYILTKSGKQDFVDLDVDLVNKIVTVRSDYKSFNN
jgi:hypothetical protein